MVRFEALAFLPWSFPNEMKFKCWCTYAPSSPGLTTASTHLLPYGYGRFCARPPCRRCARQVPRVPSPHAGVAPMGETHLPPPQRTLLLLLRSYGLIRQSQRPLPYFGLWPRWRSLRRLSPVPAARRTFPTLSPRIFPWMLDPIPRRSHSVLSPVSSAVSSAFPTRSWVGFPRIVRLKRLRAGRRFRGGGYFFMFRPPILCCPPGRPYRCAYCRRAAGAFTSGQNVLRYLRTHRIC